MVRELNYTVKGLSQVKCKFVCIKCWHLFIAEADRRRKHNDEAGCMTFVFLSSVKKFEKSNVLSNNAHECRYANSILSFLAPLRRWNFLEYKGSEGVIVE